MKTSRFVLALFLGAAVGCGGGSDSSGGDGGGDFSFDACSSIGLKIANGDQCRTGDNPRATSVVRLDITSSEGSGLCTGTAVTSNAVLTAAHCFLSGATSVDIVTTNGTVSANRIVIHPGFAVDEAAGVFYNDAAVVFTGAALPVDSAPLLLSRAPVAGEEAIVAGFGEQSPDGDLGVIVAGNATVRSVTANHIFVNFVGDEAHPCRGDSGGALLVRQGTVFAIAGVVSQSDPSIQAENVCRKGDVTLYTNTQNDSVLSFLRQVVPSAGAV